METENTNTLPNAASILKKNKSIYNKMSFTELLYLRDAIIEFTKLHVKEALRTASEEAYNAGSYEEGYWIDKDSILNSYPLDKIK